MITQAMILYPDTQAQAHREIDSVVGPDRLPTWEDRENLPYVRACIVECLRWMPTTLSAAVPHSNSKDDIYKNYHIVKGSALMMNVWALNNANWSNPRVFDPTRHDAESTALEISGINPNSTLRPHFTFGAGRRVCPGFHIAERGLFMAISRILWAFTFEKVEGEEIIQDAVTPGFIVRPVDYGYACQVELVEVITNLSRCVIKARDPGRVEVIRREWEAAQKYLDSDGNFTEEFFQRVSMHTKKA